MSDEQPIQSPLVTRGPRALMDRKIIVQSGETSTFRLMHDPKDTDQRWFAQGERPIRRGNEVSYLVRGEETYAAMAEAIKLTSAPLDEPDPNHKPLIYMLGWICDIDLPLVVGDPNSTMRNLLQHASSLGVEVRVMLWANAKGPGSVRDAFTFSQVKFVNTLPTGRAILDAKTAILMTLFVPNAFGGDATPVRLHRGSHHQKVLVTNGKEGLVAFCGGIDLNADRTDQTPGSGFHDVHCRIRGPAAHDLLSLFSDRWQDYLATVDPDREEHDVFPPRFPPTALDTLGKVDHSRDFLSAGRVPRPGPVFGEQLVQIGRTTPKGLYPGFRPQGEQSVRRMVLKAIESARSFIYMEDQYLLNLECADALAQAAAKSTLKHITIVIPTDDAVDQEFLGLASFHRAQFVRRLRSSAGANKIQIYCANRYVHSKTYIFDDRYVITGSANCNRRGWESDSEVVAGIFDEATVEAPVLRFAKRLRMKLWADHLNLANVKAKQSLRPSNIQDEYAELSDGIASAAHWRKRTHNARVSPYEPTDHLGKTAQQAFEQSVRDRAAEELKASNLRPTLRQAAFHLLSGVDAFLTSHAPQESRVWDEVIDPPSPL